VPSESFEHDRDGVSEARTIAGECVKFAVLSARIDRFRQLSDEVRAEAPAEPAHGDRARVNPCDNRFDAGFHYQAGQMPCIHAPQRERCADVQASERCGSAGPDICGYVSEDDHPDACGYRCVHEHSAAQVLAMAG
jgi:hypothetical protein